MTLWDYQKSIRLEQAAFDLDTGFYGVVMCAMRMADTNNTYKLKSAFPEVHAELVARYNAPGGLLPGEEDPNEPRPDIATSERADQAVGGYPTDGA